MTSDRVLLAMSKVFNMPTKDLGDNPALGETEGWDSMNHINLVTVLEKEFKIKLDDDDFEAMVNLENIVSIIDSYLEK